MLIRQLQCARPHRIHDDAVIVSCACVVIADWRERKERSLVGRRGDEFWKEEISSIYKYIQLLKVCMTKIRMTVSVLPVNEGQYVVIIEHGP